MTDLSPRRVTPMEDLPDQNTAATRLRSSLKQRLERMIRANPTRIDYAEKLAEMIDRYNSGAANITVFFEELKRLASSLTEGEERHVREELTEEELAVFDLLTNPDPIQTLFDGGLSRRVRPIPLHPQMLRRSRARFTAYDGAGKSVSQAAETTARGAMAEQYQNWYCSGNEGGAAWWPTPIGAVSGTWLSTSTGT